VLFDKLREKYRRSGALVDPRPERYLGADKELKLSVCMTLVAAAFLLILTYYFGYIDASNPIIIGLVLVVVAPWLRVVDVLFSANNLKRDAEEELSYAVIASASVSRTRAGALRVPPLRIQQQGFQGSPVAR